MKHSKRVRRAVAVLYPPRCQHCGFLHNEPWVDEVCREIRHFQQLEDEAAELAFTEEPAHAGGDPAYPDYGDRWEREP